MKLLEKKQINETVQSERKNQIDSGIFLAKKVDTLRQELLDLEKEQADFIATSKQVLENSIGELQRTKSTLEVDIKDATRQLQKLREPLDKEWTTVKKQKSEVLQLQTQISNYLQSLIKERSELLKEKDRVNVLLESAINHENQTYEILQKNDQDRKEIKKLLSETKNLKESKESELYIKELSIDEREKSLKNREETLKKDRLELNKEKKLLSIKKQRIS